jgi:hypothetical protein
VGYSPQEQGTGVHASDKGDLLYPWKSLLIFVPGTPLGVVSTRKVMTTSWGAVHEENAIKRVWTPQLYIAHINCFEFLTVSLSLKHFLPSLQNCPVLIRTDNMTVVAYST